MQKSSFLNEMDKKFNNFVQNYHNNSLKPVKELLEAVYWYLQDIKEGSGKRYEVNSSNPFDYPLDEPFSTIREMEEDCFHLISSDYFNKRLKHDKHFREICGKKVGSRNYIQCNRAMYYLWNNSSPIIKNKLIEIVKRLKQDEQKLTKEDLKYLNIPSYPSPLVPTFKPLFEPKWGVTWTTNTCGDAL